MSSWVDSGLLAHSATFAPEATSARMRFAVSVVTCMQAPMRTPSSGRLALEALADGREHGHVAVGPQDAGKSFVGQAEVLDVVVLGHGVSLVMVWRLFCFQRTTRAICPPQAPAALHKDHG